MQLKKLYFLLFISLGSFSFSQTVKKFLPSKPKLVVGIVVDQMRNDYIYRYWDRYGNGGFKKLVNSGYYLRNAHYNYVPTITGPGHASIFTGTTPRVHGIIANDWYDKNK
ncbi:MAG: alkaline phosphatase family protein [Sphingobacteriaceae bacterium]|nr:alkaline phosphatase family protein [Sphingobacteriaceae bacterium]